MIEFLTLKPEAFGLDISDSSLKLAKLKKKNGVLSLASFGELEIKPGIIQDGEIKNEDAFAAAVKELLAGVKGERLNTKYAVVSLPEEKTFLQVIQMPILGDEELKKAVYFEAENYIPLPIQTLYFDSQAISPLYDHLDHKDVLIVAHPRKIIDSYVSCLKKIGLTVKALEPVSQAVARALVENEKSFSPLFLIDFETEKARLVIFSGSCVRFTASLPAPFCKFNEALPQAPLPVLKKGGELTLKYGIDAGEAKESKEVFKSIAPSLRDFAEQIKRHLNYYRSHASHEHFPPDGKLAEKIYLSGSPAILKGLAEFLNFEFNLSVEIADPWINILPRPLKEAPELTWKESLGYAAVLGLALREIKEA